MKGCLGQAACQGNSGTIGKESCRGESACFLNTDNYTHEELENTRADFLYNSCENCRGSLLCGAVLYWLCLTTTQCGDHLCRHIFPAL